MLIIAIVSRKGGVAKTTTAVHLAVAAHQAGLAAAIFDLDPQGTAEAWGDWRKGQDPVVFPAKASNLTKMLDRAKDNGAEIAFIDTPPLAEADAAAAARASDLVLIPCRPRAFDLHAIRLTADLVRTVGKTGYVIFNGGHPSATRSAYAEPEEIVTSLGLKVCPVHISERADFHRAVMTGQAAQEIAPDSRAAAEILALWQWVREHTSVQAQKHTKRKNTKTKVAA